MIRQRFLNLHHHIPVTGTQTNTKFTGLAFMRRNYQTLPQLFTTLNWKKICRFFFMGSIQLDFTSYGNLSNIRPDITVETTQFTVLNNHLGALDTTLRILITWYKLHVLNYISFLGVFILVGIFYPSFNPGVAWSELYPSWLLVLTI